MEKNLNELNVVKTLLEIELPDPDAFLKIRETLTRIGVASSTKKVLYPSCHILHKRGQYYIVSFLELFALEGRQTTMTQDDVQRRNTIAKLLESWGLCKIVTRGDLPTNPASSIFIIPFKEKRDWVIEPKYKMMGERKKEREKNRQRV